jgi:predicted nucleotidyltransferase
MKNAAVVAEYNPFHNGHRRQLDIIRAAGADTVTVIMNGDHVQRGEPSVMRKHARAEIAVRCGADLVIELPFVFGISSSEKFAYGAVKTLNACGVIDTLCFGSETVDSECFVSAANSFFEADRKGLIKKYMGDGISYPRAVSMAMAELGADFIPESSNDLLAFEYVKSLIRIGSNIEPFTHDRDSQYSAASPEDGERASASAIRRLMTSGQNISTYLPPESYSILEREVAAGRCALNNVFERTLLSMLRKERLHESIDPVYGINEGLCQRILKNADAVSLSELYQRVKTKRYTMSAVRRTVLSLAYGIKEFSPEPEYIRVLAFNEKGRALLAEMRKKATLPIYHTLPSDMNSSLLVKYEALSTDMYNVYADKILSAGEDFRANSLYLTL